MGLLSGCSLAISDAFALLCIKFGYSPAQVLLVKSLAMMAIMIPLLIYKRIDILKLKRKDTVLNIVKSICENAGDIFFYYGMDAIGMGDATSIAAGSMPIFSPLFACIFIQEKCRFHDCIGLVINVAGIILISQPEFIFGNGTNPSSSIGYVYSILAGLFLSTGTVCSRAMSNELSLIVVIFYNGVLGTVLTLILVVPTSNHRMYSLILDYPITIPYIVGMVIWFLAYLYSFNRALQVQSAGKTSILLNISLIVSFLADVIVFHKHVVNGEIIGATLIIFSSIVVFLVTCYETKQNKNEETTLILKPQQHSTGLDKKP
ncbi:solute carrier family 35 member G1-like [Saccoglossus kowalevskii]|uniref:Solute carrier family 35 member G1-like n=1 Tax=Saccoglossus kowalevskii TaxID=10224 RepID=A0ABM0MB95_SACKO|nr:PREDICTED: solute carrier family 35 member G1-like [Saccoglossus kowalevskii]